MRTASGARKRAPSKSRSLRLFIGGFFSIGIFFAALTWFFILPMVFESWLTGTNTMVLSLAESGNQVSAVHLVNQDAVGKRTVFSLSDAQATGFLEYDQYSLADLATVMQQEQWSTWFIRSTFSQLLVAPVDAVIVLDPAKLTHTLFTRYILNRAESISINSVSELEKHRVLLSQLSSSTGGACSFAVVNASTKVGLATEFTKVLEKNGAVVVRVDSLPAEVHSRYVVHADEHCLESARKASYFLPEEPAYQQLQELPNFADYRANIVLILADEY